MGKPTLVLITKNLPPDIGGMETMWLNAIKDLTHLANLHVIAPEKCRPYVEQYCSFHGTPNAFPLFLLNAAIKAVKLSKRKNRKVYLLAGSGTTLLPVALAGLFSKADATVYLHGLDIIYPNPLYQATFKLLSTRIKAFFCNSENTCKLAINAGIQPSQITKVLPAANSWQQPERIQDSYKISQNPLNIVYFGRIIPRKGLLEFMQKALPLILRQRPNTHLHIIGENVNSGQSTYLAQVIDTCESAEFKTKTTLWGKLPKSALVEVVSQCDVNIFPLVETPGDVEGFGIVVLEAISLGVPTVAFDCGGVADAITLAGHGQLVSPGNYDHFANAIMQIVEQETIAAKPTYSWSEFSINIMQGLQTLP